MVISKVSFIFRKKNPRFFSIERVFNQVIQAWHFPEKTEIITLPESGLAPSNLLFLRKKARKENQTIFHVTGDAHYAVFALPRRHTLLTIHDCVFIQQNRGIKKWLLKKILLDWPVAYLKYVSTISEKTREEIIQLTHCNPEKIKVITNPVSENIYYKEKLFNATDPTLLFIGVTANKNLERVAQAIKDIPCKLIIIGSPSNDQIKLMESNKIQFKFVAGLSDSEVADQYANADIVLFPSLYEGFGLPIIEGFKAGRAVITSNISPLKELAGDAASLVDPLSVESIRTNILKVVNDEVFRNGLISGGFQIVKKFEASIIAEEYHKLYKIMN